MAQATAAILGDRLTAGIVVVKEGYGEQTPAESPIAILEAGHPLPDARGVEAARRIAALLAETRPDDLVICLISGGGSALLTLPVNGLSLEGLRALTEATRGLIGAEELKLMKPDAILINTARGGLVDSAALAAALGEGRIGAAAIDVLSQEPPVDGDPLPCLSIANQNAPDQNVVAGPRAAVRKLVARCRAAGVRAVELRTACAFHSPLMAPSTFCPSARR